VLFDDVGGEHHITRFFAGFSAVGLLTSGLTASACPLLIKRRSTSASSSTTSPFENAAVADAILVSNLIMAYAPAMTICLMATPSVTLPSVRLYALNPT